jgi:hypothetical protein
MYYYSLQIKMGLKTKRKQKTLLIEINTKNNFFPNHRQWCSCVETAKRE